MAQYKPLLDPQFDDLKESLEEQAIVESVTRTVYDDIINVTISSDAFRPAQINKIMEKYDFELTHINLADKRFEYTQK